MTKEQHDFTMLVWYSISTLILVVFGLYLIKKANTKEEIVNAIGCILFGLTPGCLLLLPFAFIFGFTYVVLEFIPSITMKLKKIDPNT